jgi:hypothetical protein
MRKCPAARDGIHWTFAITLPLERTAETKNLQLTVASEKRITCSNEHVFWFRKPEVAH